MRSLTKKIVAGGAAMLVSAGAAQACQEASTVEQADRAMTSVRQRTSRGPMAGAQSDCARARASAAVNGDRSGYVTPDELEKLSRELIERVEREWNAQMHEPTFTDEG